MLVAAWSQYGFDGAAGLTIAIAALIRFVPPRQEPKAIEGNPTLLAYLGGGTRRALNTAIAMLHARGTVRAARPGVIERGDGPAPGIGDEPLTAAVYTALDQPDGPRGIITRRPVQRAIEGIRAEVIAAGFLVSGRRWVTSRIMLAFGPILAGSQLGVSRDVLSWTLFVALGLLSVQLDGRGRHTRAGRAAFAEQRRDHPLPDTGTNAQNVGYAVAAHGYAGLLLTMPDFTKEGGLLDGGIAVQLGNLDNDAAGAPDPGSQSWGY